MIEFYKIIQRDSNTKRQIKKRIYETKKKFEKYSPDLINRYTNSYDVETYKLDLKSNWILIKSYPRKVKKT